MPDTPQLVEPGDESEFAFARFVSLLGVTPKNPGTFFPGETVSLPVAWQSWSDSYFSPVIAPAFVATFQEGMASRTDEIVEIDRNLGKSFPDEMLGRSRLAGEPFFEGKEEMRANRAWTRYSSAVAEGNAPGNLPIVFALQSALFQLPLPSALGAYAWFELRTRNASHDGGMLKNEASEEEKSLFSEILPKVAVAVGGNFGEFGDDFGPLRSV